MAEGHLNVVVANNASATTAAVIYAPGGIAGLFVSGTFDSATVEPQVRARGAAGWVSLSNFAASPATAPFVVNVTVPTCEFRLKINSPGGGTSISAHLVGYPPS